MIHQWAERRASRASFRMMKRQIHFVWETLGQALLEISYDTPLAHSTRAHRWSAPLARSTRALRSRAPLARYARKAPLARLRWNASLANRRAKELARERAKERAK